MIVVSDTSPILNLGRIGRLELLPALYHQALIPEAVRAELDRASAPLPQIGIALKSWLNVAAAQDRQQVARFRKDLDLGEAEAIALALERQADLLLVDERRGRQTAIAAGLKVTGLLGVIANAKRSGLILHARPVLDDLIHVARFWIGPALYAEVLAQLGEN